MTGRTGKAAGNEGDMMDSENKVEKKKEITRHTYSGTAEMRKLGDLFYPK